jgi:rod shape-determining protein MreD
MRFPSTTNRGNDTLTLLSRAVPLVLIVLMIQVGVISNLEAFDAFGDIVLLVAIAAGSVGGPDRGAMYGFCAGIAYDLLLDTPFGMSALVYALVGYAVGMAAVWMIQPRWWFHVASAGVASGVAVLLTALVSRVLGTTYPLEELGRIAGVVAAWNMALILPARRVMQWALGTDPSERYRVAVG